MANPVKGAISQLGENVINFADVQRQQFIDKIKSAMENVPYIMNLPYEISRRRY